MTTRPGYVWDATASEWVEIGQAAVLAPIKYQTSQPSSPATGDIWIDSDDEVPSVDSTLYYRWTKTMSGGETSLNGTDNNSLALKYTPGYESVFINGVLQVRGSDYVATTGTTVTGLIALTASDVVMVESIVAYSVGDTYTQTQISSLLDAKSPVSTTGAVLLNTTTFSAQSSVSINNVFSASYSVYSIIGSLAASSLLDINLKLRASGTDSTTGYYGRELQNLSGTVYTKSNSGNGYFAISSTNQYVTTATMINPFSAVPTSWTTYAVGGAGGGAPFVVQSGNSHDVSTSYDGFTIVPTSGTITGTIKVYGYK